MDLQITFKIRDLHWNLSSSFALTIPSLDVPRHQTTALLGRSGSGKSSLLSLLGRVEGGYFPDRPPATGSIVLQATRDETPLNLLGMSERALLRARVRGPKLGFVFQREGLFPERDACDNVAWPLVALGASPREARERALATLEVVGLAPERRVATLSGGERKRLALGRALALEPAVLLLDEPLTGLDPEALVSLRALLRDLGRTQRRTVVIVTHQPDDITELADHLIFMDQGAVACAGPRADLEDTLARFFAGAPPSREAT